MNADIKTLIQMNIQDIKNLERMQKNFNNTCGDIIDRQIETVSSYIEQKNIDGDWCNNFLKEIEINDN